MALVQTDDSFFSRPTWEVQLEKQKEQADKTGFVELNLIEAMNMAFDEEMGSNEKVLIMGEDVGRDGGIFRPSLALARDSPWLATAPLARCNSVASRTKLCTTTNRKLPGF
jgi:hypothetical protein